MPKWEAVADRVLCALSDPRLSNPSQDEKEVLLRSEELGSIRSSLSSSPTHLSHTTNFNPFENKVWEIYFYKVCSFVHWSSYLIMFLLIFVYVYVCDYTTILARESTGQLYWHTWLNSYHRCWWFGLISYFNGISIFVGYFIPKPSFKKNSRGTILFKPYLVEIMELIAFQWV